MQIDGQVFGYSGVEWYDGLVEPRHRQAPQARRLRERVRSQAGLVAYHRERAHRMGTVEAACTLRSAEDELADRGSALRSYIRRAKLAKVTIEA